MFTLYDKISTQISLIDNYWTYDSETNYYLFKIKTYTNKNDSTIYDSEDYYMFEILDEYNTYYNTDVYGKLSENLVQVASDLLEVISLNNFNADNSNALRIVAEKFNYDLDSKDFEIHVSDKMIKVTFYQDTSNAYLPFKEEIYITDLDRVQKWNDVGLTTNEQDYYEKSYKMYTVLDKIRSHNNYTYTYYADFYNLMKSFFESLESDDTTSYLTALNEQKNDVYYNTRRYIDEDDNLSIKEIVIKGKTISSVINTNTRIKVFLDGTQVFDDGGFDVIGSYDDTIELFEYIPLDIESTEYSTHLNTNYVRDNYNETTVTNVVDGGERTETTVITTYGYKEFYLTFYIDDTTPLNNFEISERGSILLTDSNGDVVDEYGATLEDIDDDITNYSAEWNTLVNTKKLKIDSIMSKLMVFMIDRDMDKSNIWDLNYYAISRSLITYITDDSVEPNLTEDIMTENYDEIITLLSRYIRVEQDTIQDK